MRGEMTWVPILLAVSVFISSESAPPVWPCGDCNGDLIITGADAIYLAGCIHRSGPAPIGEGDVNLDTTINMDDVYYILDYVYRGGPPPCQPE